MTLIIAAINIRKLGFAQYLAECTVQSEPIGEATLHTSIEDAIRAAVSDLPSELGPFVEVAYAGFSAGHLIVRDVAAEAGPLADRLVALDAEAHRLREQG